MSLPNVFKALSDPIRRDILMMLKKKGEMSAGDIASEFDLSNATISYHLSLLKEAGLIREQKEKNYIFYELNTSVFEEMLCYFQSFVGGDSDEEK